MVIEVSSKGINPVSLLNEDNTKVYLKDEERSNEKIFSEEQNLTAANDPLAMTNGVMSEMQDKFDDEVTIEYEEVVLSQDEDNAMVNYDKNNAKNIPVIDIETNELIDISDSESSDSVECINDKNINRKNEKLPSDDSDNQLENKLTNEIEESKERPLETEIPRKKQKLSNEEVKYVNDQSIDDEEEDEMRKSFVDEVGEIK